MCATYKDKSRSLLKRKLDINSERVKEEAVRDHRVILITSTDINHAQRSEHQSTVHHQQYAGAAAAAVAWRHSLTCSDVEGQRLGLEAFVYSPIQLAKLRQPSRAHPNDEVLVFHTLDRADNIRIRLVQKLRLWEAFSNRSNDTLG